MAEKRLIDANGLKKRMCFKCNDEYSDEPCEPSDCVFCNTINDAPTVDAVPVVRCRECKYWNEDALACNTLLWVNSSEHANWYENDFCSYGERKDGDGNG